MLGWKRPDTRLLVLLGAALAAAAGVLLLVLPWPLARALVSIAAFVLVSWLILGLARGERRAREMERAELQALVALHQLLAPRLPLPELVGWAASPRLALAIASAILENRPSLVVELGSGASTLVAGYATERCERGRVVSIDHVESYAGETRRRIEAHQLSPRAEVRHAGLEARDVEGAPRRWYAAHAFEDLEEIGLLIVDGPPEQSAPDARAPAFALLGPRLAKGATVIVDDVARPAERRAVERFVASVGATVRYLHSEKGVAIVELPNA